ncbi:hypothetical protein [uncultured Ruegeria sp.]|uniref:hypothetical protein n=1 Tax=uncultured Ruegeria sp. TaxID=259304 RepID=UPI0026334F55|nr:hypothetical protein [uncultured Ruegeria sp.]
MFFQNKIPSKYANQIERYKRLGLIEVYHVDKLGDFYSEEDFQIAEQTRALAKYLIARIAPPMLSKSGYKFNETDISNISAGLELQLADNLYSRTRQLVAIIDACHMDRADLWEDYGNSILRNLKTKDHWWMNSNRSWPTYASLVAEEPRFCDCDVVTSAFGRFPTTRPQTLLLGNPGQPTYVRSAEAIGYAEHRLGKLFEAIFEVRYSETLNPLRWGDKFTYLPSEFYLNSPKLVLGGAKLQLSLANNESPSTVHARLAKSDPMLAQRNGLNPETWFALLLSETITATNATLARIAGFYDCIMNNKQFQNIETLICSPSRSTFFVPVVLGMKQKGVKTIEYQAFFWSAHPRYQVLDLDLFICSDAATMKVVEEKLSQNCNDTKLMLGPFFGMTKFMTDYAEALLKTSNERSTKPVGMALQPANAEIFEEACRLITGAGFEVLCRPHPKQDRAQVEAQFGKYGKIDDGTLVDFIRDTSLVVTGFSNVALQTALVGKTAVCLPTPNLLGLDLTVASPKIHQCNTLQDLQIYLGKDNRVRETFEFRDPIEHWCDIRRSEMPDQMLADQANE